jgi:hypothetical protein
MFGFSSGSLPKRPAICPSIRKARANCRKVALFGESLRNANQETFGIFAICKDFSLQYAKGIRCIMRNASKRVTENWPKG